MSYRELRNICEMCRALGYPRLLSIENFRTANFKLIAELVEWIVKRFEPNASLSCEHINTEQERVLFVKQAVLLLLHNSRLKLNPKKIYQADGYAVQEIIPALRLIYDASRQQQSDDRNIQWNNIKTRLNTKMQDVRIASQLSSQLPQTASSLNDLLTKEIFYRKHRQRATARPIPTQEAEKTVHQSIQALNKETQEITTKLNNISNDESALDEKIDRKKREYEQMQKRFAKLQSFRPQYMDEYEKYENKLKQLYEIYVLKFRNLAYLQHLLLESERSDRQRQAENERNMRQIVEKMRVELSHSPPLDPTEQPDVPPLNQDRRASRKVIGNMLGAGMSEDEDDEDLEIKSEASYEISHNENPNQKEELSSGDDF